MTHAASTHKHAVETVCPFPSKHDVHHIAAYQDIHARLCNANRKPLVHILDNEASLAFGQAITSNGCTFQLVPPPVHSCNAGERAIRTFKDHFLAILVGTAPSFPADRWDLLIPHAELTLNLLSASRCNLALSAWEDLFGPFNFDATLLGPVGCGILIHSKATTQHLGDFCSHEGFYIGPALCHYCCYCVLNKELRAVAITDALKFRHHYLPTPDLTAEDKIIAALQQLRLATKSQRDNYRQYTNCVMSSITTPLPRPTRTQHLQGCRHYLQGCNQNRLSETPRWTRPQQPPGGQYWSTPNTMVDQPIATRTHAGLLATDPSHNSFVALAETTD
eukprot:CCRYP_019439-RB/>CCRYP_019439-RB protein AED:0.56 eAED:0.39 QI:0/0/0/1/0/0/2/0/333